MALINCPECGSQVSSRAKSCLKCFYPIKELGNIHQAVFENKLDLVRDILKSGANVNLRDSHENTPLMIAAFRGEDAIIHELLKQGADPNVKRTGGFTALMDAAAGGHAGAINLLADAGADLDAKNEQGKTAREFVSRKLKRNLDGVFHQARIRKIQREKVAETQNESRDVEEYARLIKGPKKKAPVAAVVPADNPLLGCKVCSTEIAPGAITCDHCKTLIVRRYCYKCSKLIPSHAPLCPHCGAAGEGSFRYLRHLDQLMYGGLALLALVAFFVLKDWQPEPELTLRQPAAVSKGQQAAKQNNSAVKPRLKSISNSVQPATAKASARSSAHVTPVKRLKKQRLSPPIRIQEIPVETLQPATRDPENRSSGPIVEPAPTGDEPSIIQR